MMTPKTYALKKQLIFLQHEVYASRAVSKKTPTTERIFLPKKNSTHNSNGRFKVFFALLSCQLEFQVKKHRKLFWRFEKLPEKGPH